MTREGLHPNNNNDYKGARWSGQFSTNERLNYYSCINDSIIIIILVLCVGVSLF